MADRHGNSATFAGAIAVALWLGAASFFAAAVAPSAFGVLPSRELAGALVGRLLPVIFVLGITLGAAVLFLEARPPHTRHWLVRATGATLIAVACAVAQLGIAPRIARIREAAGGTLDSLGVASPERVDFGRLHAMSVAWLAVAILAAISVVAFAWLSLRESSDTRGAADSLTTLGR